MIKAKLLTLRELGIVDNDKDLDSKVCPMCKNTLRKKNGVYFCNNLECDGYREGFEEIKNE